MKFTTLTLSRTPVPFLFCLPDIDRVISVLAELDAYTGRQHRRHIKRPAYLDEKLNPVSFDYAGEDIETIAREMRRAPSRSRGE